jgi:hypothetical protein
MIRRVLVEDVFVPLLLFPQEKRGCGGGVARK